MNTRTTLRTAVAGFALASSLVAGSAVAQQGQTETVELFNGCNNVSITWPSGTATSEVSASITPSSNIRSIWRFNNGTQVFQGFSPQFPAQSDLTTVNRIDAVFVCMTGPGTMTRPRI